MKITILLLLLLSVISGQDRNGWYYNSSFGFKASNIPENWIVMTKESTQKNFDYQRFDFFKTLDKEMLNQVKKLVQSEKMEIIYYKKYNENFNNNIGVTAAETTIPLELKEKFLCASFEKDLQVAYNRKNVKLYSCQIRNISGIKTLTYVHDGLLVGTKSMGYLFNTDKRMIRMISTCDNKYCSIIKKDTELIFNNLSFNRNKIVPKAKVEKRMIQTKEFLQKELCKNNSFFRDCFNLTHQTCLLYAKKYLNICSKRNINILSDEQNYKNMGQIIGRCTGEEMGNNLNNEFKNTEQCINWKF